MSISPTGGTDRKKLSASGRGFKDALSSDEEIFYDPNNVPLDIDDIKSNPETDDEFFDPQEGNYKSRRKSSDAESSRPNSPLNGDGLSKPYTNLRNLAGLSSPINHHDDNSSQKESVISSLSSTSQDNEGRHFFRDDDPPYDFTAGVDDSLRPTGSNRRGLTRANGSGGGGSSSPTAAKEQDPNVKQLLDDAQVFQHIFSSADIGPTVRVTGTSKLGKGSFKDKVRLVQTMDVMHDGPVWSMKFSPNGHYLATGGQDAKVIVWCVAEIPKSENANGGHSGGSGHHSHHHGGASTSQHHHGYTGDSSSVAPVSGLSADSSSRPNAENLPHGTMLPTYATQNQEIDGTNHVIGHFLLNEPYRILEGHTADITDLSWSRSSFLLSASMDHFVRLWHVSKRECLQEFKHPDAVTAVEFNPLHDRYFVSGCFDRRIRVWDIIPDGQVREWAQAPDTVTALTVSPDGQTVVAGLIQGQIFFYEYEGMRYKTQMDCRNRSGKYKNGCKVTGLAYLLREHSGAGTGGVGGGVGAAGATANLNNMGRSVSAMSHLLTAGFPPRRKMTMVSHGQLLVTTNDHRIRLCRLDDYSVISKYKGLKNKAMQIKATTSEDGKYTICGSDSGDVYLWKTHEQKNGQHGHDGANHGTHLLFTFDKVYKNSEYESFDGCDTGNGSSTAAGATTAAGGNTNHSHRHGSMSGASTVGGVGNGGEYGNVSVICAIFAPVESIRRYLRSQHGLLLKLKEQAAANAAAAQLLGIPPSALGFGRKLPHPNATNGNNTNSSHSAAEQLLGRRSRQGSATTSLPTVADAVTPPPVAPSHHSHLAAAYQTSHPDPRLMMTDLSSRIILTADTDGMLRIFYRMT
jgi:WD40 repeat protein